jgi:hypothetical protein
MQVSNFTGSKEVIKKRHLLLAGAAGFIAAYFVIVLELKLAVKSLTAYQVKKSESTEAVQVSESSFHTN